YLCAAASFVMSRLPVYASRQRLLSTVAFVAGIAGLAMHLDILWVFYSADRIGSLTLAAAVSLVSLQLALIALIGGLNLRLRGMSAGLLALAALLAIPMHMGAATDTSPPLTWQTQTHVLVSMFAYGLLTVGAIVAVYSLVQERRLKSAQISALNNLFAPLETTERLLYGITTAGFVGLALAVVSGFTFVDNLFAQNLVHKTTFSLAALVVFGVLLAGRAFSGWRGKRAVYLYLGGFALVVLAYFGSRFILEVILDRSWG
ncbi:MAG: cytochrome c biogenesis protein CcsA, partial [Pseudomonadota bacterium]